MTRVSAKGVFVGGVVDIGATYAVSLPLMGMAIVQLELGELPEPEFSDALMRALAPGSSYYLVGLVLGSACGILGGYVAARLAKHDARLNGALSAWLGMLLGTYNWATGGSADPSLAHIGYLVLGPAMGTLGGYLSERKRSKPPSVRPSLASVTFDASGLRLHDDGDDSRVWSTPAGDRVALYFFGLKPDLDTDLRSIDATRQVSRSRAAAIGAAIVEVSITTVDGCPALRQVIKVRQQPHGITYLGSLVLPFRDFSFVVKVQCPEGGLTGMRDAVILAEAMADGRVGDTFEGWMHDPYDPALHDGFHYNLSEASEYDSRFPTHPLTRLRAVLAQLEQSIRVTSEVRHAPAYIFPSGG